MLYSEPTGPTHRRVWTGSLCFSCDLPSRSGTSSSLSTNDSPPLQPSNQTVDSGHYRTCRTETGGFTFTARHRKDIRPPELRSGQAVHPHTETGTQGTKGAR